MKLAQGNPLLYNKNVRFKAPEVNYIGRNTAIGP